MPAVRSRAILALAILATALAGCSGGDGGAPAPSDGPSAEQLGLQATESTGLIRGVVVDDAIRPLANVTVTVKGSEERQQRTDASGAFGFDGLDPGTYFLTASKLGYFDAQQSAEVVAGVTDPPAVKIQLAVDVGYKPYFQAIVYEGFIECTTSVLVLCGAANAEEPLLCAEFNLCYGQVTNDRFTFTLYFDPNLTMVQSELVWATNQALSPELSFTQESINPDESCPPISLDTAPMNGTSGPSPLFTRVHADVLQEWEVGPKCGIYYSVFAGDASGDPTGQGVPVGATVEQRFTFYIHAFYGYLPPADWRFTGDEVVPAPPQ